MFKELLVTSTLLMLHLTDISLTHFLLKRRQKEKKDWYRHEGGLVARFFYKNLGLNKGTIFGGLFTISIYILVLIPLIFTIKIWVIPYLILLLLNLKVVTHNLKCFMEEV